MCLCLAEDGLTCDCAACRLARAEVEIEGLRAENAKLKERIMLEEAETADADHELGVLNSQYDSLMVENFRLRAVVDAAKSVVDAAKSLRVYWYAKDLPARADRFFRALDGLEVR